jgi:hypothetical protein
MLAGGWTTSTGKKTSCPEQDVLSVQLALAVGRVGVPFVTIVVATVDVIVDDPATVVSLKNVLVAVITVVPVDVVVTVEPFSVYVMLIIDSAVTVIVVSTGILVTVDVMMMVSNVVIGTVTACVMVLSGVDVVYSKETLVGSGCRVEAVMQGMLVGKGCKEGLPSVSSIVTMVCMSYQ